MLLRIAMSMLRMAPLLFVAASPGRAPDLAPLAFAKFCSLYPGECETSGNRMSSFTVTPSILRQLDDVNRSVNVQIKPDPFASRLGPIPTWTVSPPRGDCNAYAITKRHTLATIGYPTSLLLLTAVRTTSGEHHMVLVIPAEGGDLILDNLSAQIRPLRATGYTVLKQQSAENPKFWFRPL